MASNELAFWTQLVSKATRSAMNNLSKLVGQEIAVDEFAISQIPVANISQLMGGQEEETIGIYLSVSGDSSGHILLLYEPKMAYGFIDMLMGLPAGSTTSMDTMEESALGELGNVVGSSFLNTLANSTGLKLQPSPPQVRTDMAGSLLDIIASEIMLTQDKAFISEARYRVSDREIAGLFFVIPTHDLLQALHEGSYAA